MVWTSSDLDRPIPTEPLYRKIVKALEARVAADNEAIVLIRAENDSTMTCAELLLMTRKFVRFFEERGIGQGDVIQGCTPNSPEYLAYMIAANAVGAIHLPFDPHSTETEARDTMKKYEVKAILSEERHLDSLLRASLGTGLKTIIGVRETEYKEFPPEVVDFDDILKLEPANLGVDRYTFDPEEIAFMPSSSGTTGRPKCVMLSQKALIHSVETVVENSEIWDKQVGRSNNYTIVQQQMYHSFGMLITFRCLIRAEIPVFLREINPVLFFKCIQKYQPRMLLLTPFLVMALTKHPEAENYDLSSVRALMSTASFLGRELTEEYKKKYPNVQVCQGYGATEVGFITTPRFEEGEDYTTSGSLVAGASLKILDEDGNELGYNEPGDIYARTGALFTAYWKQEEETKAAFSDGFYNTGDIGKMLPNGKLVFIDRKKELMKVNSIAVAAAEIEDFLLKLGNVTEAAVVKIDHPETIEAPYAFLVRNSMSLSEENVWAHINEHLGPWKRPVGFEFVDKLPRNRMGKVIKAELLQTLEERKTPKER